MTLHNLSKILDRYQGIKFAGSVDLEQQVVTQKLRCLPFYNFQNIGDTHTFNQALGLPLKNGREFPLLDYEQLLYDILQKHKHVWIKKATGLGITQPKRIEGLYEDNLVNFHLL